MCMQRVEVGVSGLGGRQRCKVSSDLAGSLDVGVGSHIRVDGGLSAYFGRCF